MSVAAHLATSDRRPTGRRGVEFRESWMFKGDAVERIDAMMGDAPGPVVHVCCGAGYLKRERDPKVLKGWAPRSFPSEGGDQ